MHLHDIELYKFSILFYSKLQSGVSATCELNTAQIIDLDQQQLLPWSEMRMHLTVNSE